jgi:RNA polymerase sigma-70 factor (ECF subfamily)
MDTEKIGPNPDELYQQAAAGYGPAIDRLARAYELDPDHRRDLLQEIHLALWRSLAVYDGRCSLRTWVYRVAHNVAASHVRARSGSRLVSLESMEMLAAPQGTERELDQQRGLKRLYELIHLLQPVDRQIMLLYLEGRDAATIGEISGITAVNAATKIHRIKHLLTRQFHQGGPHATAAS